MFNSRSKTSNTLNLNIENYKDLILKDLKTKLRLTDENNKVYTTDLHSWDNEKIIFSAPIDQRDWVLFRMPLKLHACFVTQKALYTTTIQLLDRSIESNIMYYHAHICTPIVKKQQRQHFRVEALAPLEYILIPNPSDETETETETETDSNLQVYTGTLLNLSVGGMYMVCHDDFETGQALTISFNFLDHAFKLSGMVLEGTEQNANHTYSHRIRFTSMDHKTEDLLSKLLFEKQRQTLRPLNQPLYQTKA